MAAQHLGAGQLERRQGPVALVEMDDAGVDPHRPERAQRADAEQRVLGEPDGAVGDVEAPGDPAIDPPVLRAFGVEQVEGGAAHLHPPDLDHHLASAEGDPDGERVAVIAGDQGGGQALRVHRPPVLVLIAALVDALEEVALAVEEPDARPWGGRGPTPP